MIGETAGSLVIAIRHHGWAKIGFPEQDEQWVRGESPVDTQSVK